MTAFTPTDIVEIDRLWRRLYDDHPWTGWAYIEAHDSEVWLFRKQANWRRFILTRNDGGFRLVDETGEDVQVFSKIEELPNAVADMPTLAEHDSTPT